MRNLQKRIGTRAKKLEIPPTNGGMTARASTMTPPLLPDEVLRRVVRVSMFDGISVLAVAGACALISAASRDVFAAVIGLLVAGAGAMELNGASLLRAGSGRGMRWLFWSHFQIGASMMAYVAFRLLNPDIASLHKVVTPELAEQIQQAGMTVDQFLTEMMRIVYFSLVAATLLYQGGMTIYYLRRRAAVMAALEEDDSP
jgi:hypothetical protein